MIGVHLRLLDMAISVTPQRNGANDHLWRFL